ncbi:hypothetical protein KCU90_g179, partial [Aureobasidium melanogenum]
MILPKPDGCAIHGQQDRRGYGFSEKSWNEAQFWDRVHRFGSVYSGVAKNATHLSRSELKRYKTIVELSTMEQGDARPSLNIFGKEPFEHRRVDFAIFAAKEYMLAVRINYVQMQVVYALVSVQLTMGKDIFEPSILSITTSRPFMPTSIRSKRFLSWQKPRTNNLTWLLWSTSILVDGLEKNFRSVTTTLVTLTQKTGLEDEFIAVNQS